VNDLTNVDLFSGIGGFSLAAQWAGFRTICFCEIDPFCQEVLKARFGAVADTEYDGRSTATKRNRGGESREGRTETSDGIKQFKGSNCQSPLLIPDIRDFDGTRFRGATLLTGGFPCQPFSCAGKRRGKADDRHLWPEMLRVISEARPTWVLGENVAGIVNMELEQVCADLEGEGYEVQPIIIPACAVNAPHRRDRVWILGRRKDADDPEGGRCGLRYSQYKRSGKRKVNTSANADSDAPDTEGRKTQSAKQGRLHAELGGTDSDAPDARIKESGRLSNIGREGMASPWENGWDTPWPEVAARLCGIYDGVSRRVDRLKALGNSIVPQVAFQIIKVIAEIEMKPAEKER